MSVHTHLTELWAQRWPINQCWAYEKNHSIYTESTYLRVGLSQYWFQMANLGRAVTGKLFQHVTLDDNAPPETWVIFFLIALQSESLKPVFFLLSLSMWKASSSLSLSMCKACMPVSLASLLIFFHCSWIKLLLLMVGLQTCTVILEISIMEGSQKLGISLPKGPGYQSWAFT